VIVTEPEQATPEWLSDVLHQPVEAVTAIDRIGTGQMSRNYRLSLTGGPDLAATIVIKVPSDDAATRELGAGAYSKEVIFYRDVAQRISTGVARCHHHEMSESGSEFTLVLDDMAPAEQGDQIAGCTIDEARRAITNLAGIHAATWNDDALAASIGLLDADASGLGDLYAMAYDQFVAHYDGRLDPATRPVLDPFRDLASKWTELGGRPSTITHGDYRLDNLLFTDTTIVAVDWQTLSYGPPARDLAYFLGNSVRIDDRRKHERELLTHYLDTLAGHGIDYSLADLQADYALGAWLGPIVTVVGAFVATRTDRGDEMFIAMADRAAAQLADHDSLSVLTT